MFEVLEEFIYFIWGTSLEVRKDFVSVVPDLRYYFFGMDEEEVVRIGYFTITSTWNRVQQQLSNVIQFTFNSLHFYNHGRRVVLKWYMSGSLLCSGKTLGFSHREKVVVSMRKFL